MESREDTLDGVDGERGDKGTGEDGADDLGRCEPCVYCNNNRLLIRRSLRVTSLLRSSRPARSADAGTRFNPNEPHSSMFDVVMVWLLLIIICFMRPMNVDWVELMRMPRKNGEGFLRMVHYGTRVKFWRWEF
jgi:hypothetical protein